MRRSLSVNLLQLVLSPEAQREFLEVLSLISSRHQFNLHPPTQGRSSTCQRRQCQAGIGIVQKAIQRGPAGVHALGHGGFGELLGLSWLR